MRKLIITSKFKKDAARAKKRGLNTSKLDEIIKNLLKDEELPAKHLDHMLSGEYSGHRECHIEPDWLLIYLKSGDGLFLTAVRTGSHSDLF
ncbi:MAG: type II toxin-antitoxin system YafQ family toxin [Coriobacteriia bacterium]|nr:type II toxin-antitoxin system YafQ family toxin [Coriobacteriia bacterium]